jgi:hypothetical protein
MSKFFDEVLTIEDIMAIEEIGNHLQEIMEDDFRVAVAFAEGDDTIESSIIIKGIPYDYIRYTLPHTYHFINRNYCVKRNALNIRLIQYKDRKTRIIYE